MQPLCPPAHWSECVSCPVNRDTVLLSLSTPWGSGEGVYISMDANQYLHTPAHRQTDTQKTNHTNIYKPEATHTGTDDTNAE